MHINVEQNFHSAIQIEIDGLNTSDDNTSRTFVQSMTEININLNQSK